ncbi:unnamed protein product [Brugia pahangi]|uniref:Ovule protein n=1 Tax=Brugia pahangi TaxID=6280 RepID=A0A0N4TIC6_BRUPA|nr:unnamed protein product [Brugia pahangi]
MAYFSKDVDEEKSAEMGHRLSIHTQDDSLASEGSVFPLRHCTFQSYNQLLLDLFLQKVGVNSKLNIKQKMTREN